MKKNGEILLEMLDNAVLVGEMPYQANRRALRAFDVLEDVEKGMQESDGILSGIDEFVVDLREVEGFARRVVKHAASFL